MSISWRSVFLTCRSRLPSFLAVSLLLLFGASIVVGPVAGTTGTASGGAETIAPGTNATAVTGSTSGPVELSSCGVIDEPGRYELTTDIDVSEEIVSGDRQFCFIIQSSDVVFDGNGHLLKGAPCSGTDGTDCAKDVEVRTQAIRAGYDPKYPLTNITVENFRFDGFAQGVAYNAVSNSLIRNTTSRGSLGYSLYVGAFAKNNVLANNTVLSSKGNGISIAERSSNTTVVNNTIRNAGHAGIGSGQTDNNELRGNLLVNNTFGIYVNRGSDNNVVVNNTVRGSEKMAIGVSSSNEAVIRNNDVRGDSYGIFLRNATGAAVVNNTLGTTQVNLLLTRDVSGIETKNNRIVGDVEQLVLAQETSATVSLIVEETTVSVAIANAALRRQRPAMAAPAGETISVGFKLVARQISSRVRVTLHSESKRKYYRVNGEWRPLTDGSNSVSGANGVTTSVTESEMPVYIVATEKIQTTTGTATTSTTSTAATRSSTTSESTKSSSSHGSAPGFGLLVALLGIASGSWLGRRL